MRLRVSKRIRFRIRKRISKLLRILLRKGLISNLYVLRINIRIRKGLFFSRKIYVRGLYVLRIRKGLKKFSRKTYK